MFGGEEVVVYFGNDFGGGCLCFVDLGVYVVFWLLVFDVVYEVGGGVFVVY